MRALARTQGNRAAAARVLGFMKSIFSGCLKSLGNRKSAFVFRLSSKGVIAKLVSKPNYFRDSLAFSLAMRGLVLHQVQAQNEHNQRTQGLTSGPHLAGDLCLY